MDDCCLDRTPDQLLRWSSWSVYEPFLDVELGPVTRSKGPEAMTGSCSLVSRNLEEVVEVESKALFAVSIVEMGSSEVTASSKTWARSRTVVESGAASQSSW